ncbi:MAG: polyprenyl synthetase family protein [Oscillospiraceae bacterium]|nr:polyprenyl synthetase family protein [Oscillospiraceae bacterium]
MAANWKEKMLRSCEMTENYLKDCVAKLSAPEELKEAMLYSLLAGGTRLRPYLCLAFCRLCGGNEQDALPFAAAVEMIHTYSLIHDDLPCMDNDDLRRGKPANHIRFGEANALLAGDALLNLAFESVLCSNLPADLVKEGLAVLGQKAGACGMIGGQTLDLAAEKITPDEEMLLQINRGKTSALIQAACVMGCVAARADETKKQAANAFGEALGITFQLTDDLLDVRGDETKLGKPIGSDEKQNKTTFVALLGISATEQRAKEENERGKEALSCFGPEKEELFLLADWLLERES